MLSASSQTEERAAVGDIIKFPPEPTPADIVVPAVIPAERIRRTPEDERDRAIYAAQAKARTDAAQAFARDVLPLLFPRTVWRFADCGVGCYYNSLTVDVPGCLGRFLDHVRTFVPRPVDHAKKRAPAFFSVTQPYPQGEPFPAEGVLAVTSKPSRIKTLCWRALPSTLSWHMPGSTLAFGLWPAGGPQPLDWSTSGFPGWAGDTDAPPHWGRAALFGA